MTTIHATDARPAILLSPSPPQISMSPLELDGYLTGIIVTPQAAPIRPSVWIARLWGDDAPVFEDEAQISSVLRAVMTQYNTLHREIDRSVERLQTERIVDYRPLFLTKGQRPEHDAVRTWVRGFWTAITLAPDTWSALVEDERTKSIIVPFVGFFDLGEFEPDEIPDDIDVRLDAAAALIPRTILLLRKLARAREAAAQSTILPRRSKLGRNDPCPCGSGEKYKRCCARA
jgi:uncharacterized protein